jgi:alpha-L-fucosidase
MRYAVLTAKHHDGFALWPTEQTDWSISRTRYQGDLVAEFVEAARAEGLRVGLYFSLCDWHHPDYPAFRDEDRPYFFRYLGRRPSPEAWERYLGVVFGQLEELLTRYGPVDLLWFDGQWERSRDEWRADDLAAHVRALQPGILVNDRLPGQGDFETPEQALPTSASSTPARPWETCMTMNRSWGWCPDDTDYKRARQLVHTLCEVAGRGGNLLLNVGPRSDGSLPEEQVSRLDTIAGWMAGNGEAIHSTTPGLEPWQFYGPTTRAGERVFLHLLYRPYDTVTVRGLALDQVRVVRHLATGKELDWTGQAPVQTLMAGSAVGEIVIRVQEDLLDELATVIEVVVDGG